MFADVSDDELGERLAARTLELIDIPSESGDEMAAVAHTLGVLAVGGVAVRDALDTCVVVELPGPAEAPLVVLAGHLDTVPIQENRPGSRDDTTVHGLGAADMKGSDAIIIETALAITAAGGAAKRVAIVLFGREELLFADSALTPLLAREDGLRTADLAIVMEPTGNTLQAGCLGNLNATWSFHGRSGHSARPWFADNAIERAAAGINRVKQATPPNKLRFDGGLEFAEVVSVTRIAGGIADNVIPDRVDCHVNCRYAPGRAPDDAEAWLSSLCNGEGETLEILSNAPSGPVSLGNPLTTELIAAGDLLVGAKQAWTPVAEFGLAGVDAVNFGPGDPKYAHRRDEQVDVEALVRCARTLEAFLCA